MVSSLRQSPRDRRPGPYLMADSCHCTSRLARSDMKPEGETEPGRRKAAAGRRSEPVTWLEPSKKFWRGQREEHIQLRNEVRRTR